MIQAALVGGVGLNAALFNTPFNVVSWEVRFGLRLDTSLIQNCEFWRKNDLRNDYTLERVLLETMG
jgi:hypothetical protein